MMIGPVAMYGPSARTAAALLVGIGGLFAPAVAEAFAEEGAARPWRVGVARVDVTPDHPVRLSGFGFRREESEGVSQPVWAKALAFDDGQDAAVLITVDNLGIPDAMTAEVARRLHEKSGLKRERLAITATHTHAAPMLTGVAPTLFGEPIPPDHQERIDRYTRLLTDRLEQAALAALEDLRPAEMAWAIGRVGFARNRRTADGPVDHDLPMLVVKSPDGRVRAVYVSYACHCVTLSFNRVSGDWAGYTQEMIERNHPEAVALVSVGCGADANPSSGVAGDRTDLAEAQGVEIAAEVNRLLAGELRRVEGPLAARMERIELPFDELPSRTEWEERARQEGPVGHHARVQLDRLDRGEALQTALDYPVQTWAFGRALAMVFLPGEVVVDYSLRLKRELDGARLWINAYANDSPCYIPSERILREGGYEGGGAMIYYDRPTRLKAGLEQAIVDAVHRQIGAAFAAPAEDAAKEGPVPGAGDGSPDDASQMSDDGDRPPASYGGHDNGPQHPGPSPLFRTDTQSPPLSPKDSLARLRVRPGFTVELVAREPLVVDPVAIDFGPDGRLWVAEMHDYPEGLDGKFQPGGRIRVLEDSTGDGRYDRATLFLDGIPFPTGVTVWRNGVLVCAAPDVLYAEDTNGDGRADFRQTLFTGFATHNYQGRVNSLAYGLDGWVYGSGGLFGGDIQPLGGVLPNPRDADGRLRESPDHPTAATDMPDTVALGNRDFRMKPDTGAIEPATGRTQQGRVRDDWGNWFGCTNGAFLLYYPLADHYLRRNPHVSPPTTQIGISTSPDPARVFPVAEELQLFELSGPAGRATSACGLGLYRDTLLGAEVAGNAFTCEPVNLLVHRQVIAPQGAVFSSRRAEGEEESEFLVSTDPWFRPVQIRTGPDGALWIVDMHRYVIEHPVWIPEDVRADLAVRAGDRMGRLYRVYPADRSPRPIARLDQLDTPQLVTALDSPNGPQRDLAQQMLVWRAAQDTVPLLERMVRNRGAGGPRIEGDAESRMPRPEARLHALCTLDALGALQGRVVRSALDDEHPGVRRHAVRLCEGRVEGSPDLAEALLRRVDDPDLSVRLQLAYTLGEWTDPRAADALADLVATCRDEPYILAAVLSSLNGANVARVAQRVLAPGLDSGANETAEGPARRADRRSSRAEAAGSPLPPPESFLSGLIVTAAALDDQEALEPLLAAVATGDVDRLEAWQLRALGRLLESVQVRGRETGALLDRSRPALEATLERARALLVDDEAVISDRLAAVAALGRLPAARPQDIALLAEQLAPRNPPAMQEAVVTALGRINDAAAAAALLDTWDVHTPGLRATILDVLLGRGDWQRILLDAIGDGRVQAAHLDAARRETLLKHNDPAVRRRAEALLAAASTPDRRQVLEDYRDVATMPGDPERGRAAFQKSCAACHRLDGIGHAVGPDLAALTNHAPEVLLEEILDPNRAVDGQYVQYVAVTLDGRVYNGVLSSESATSVTLTSQDGREQTLLRRDLEELRSTGQSLMPEGLERDLSKQDLADVIAWIGSLARGGADSGSR